MEIENYVFYNIIKPILKEDNGKKYVDDSDIAKLNLTVPEISFLKNLLKKKGIQIRVETITAADRSPRVRDLDFGFISSAKLNKIDIPEKSEILYDSDSDIDFANFDELDKFLEEKFIPENVHTKVRRTDIYGPQYQSIQLNKIVKLRLSEDEMKHVMKYLEEQGIIVCGTAVMPEDEFINYDYYNTYKTLTLPDTLNEKDQKMLFLKLKNDDVSPLERKRTRSKLIISNMRLANYVLFKLANYYDIEIDEFITHAFEGLIYAVDNYDPNKDEMSYSFSTYAVPCIKGYIQKAAAEERGIPQYLFFDFYRAQKVVENELGKKYVYGNFKMLNEILDLLVSIGKITLSQKKMIESIENINNGYMNIDELEDNLTTDSDYDESMIDKITNGLLKEEIEKVLDTLTDRESNVLKLRFGLVDGKSRTTEEVGQMFGVTRERIRQIEAKALRKLRHPSRSKRLKDYLDANHDDDLLIRIIDVDDNQRKLL